MATQKKPNRRPFNWRQNWQPELIVAGLSNASHDEVVILNLSASPIIKDIPRATWEEELPLSCVQTGPQQITLTYPSAHPGQGVVFYAWDPAIRTASGGYMSAQQIITPV